MLFGLFVGHTLPCVASTICSCLCSTPLAATCRPRVFQVLHVRKQWTHLLHGLSVSLSGQCKGDAQDAEGRCRSVNLIHVVDDFVLSIGHDPLRTSVPFSRCTHFLKFFLSSGGDVVDVDCCQSLCSYLPLALSRQIFRCRKKVVFQDLVHIVLLLQVLARRC